MPNILDAEKQFCKYNGENIRTCNSKEFRKVGVTPNRVTYITNKDFDNMKKERKVSERVYVGQVCMESIEMMAMSVEIM